jgi:hypothetical protein
MVSEMPSGRVQRGPRRVSHPSTVTHLRWCRQCQELLGVALTYLPVGRCVVRMELAGAPGVEVREVGGLYWVLKGDRVEEVTQDCQEAMSVGDRLSAEALTPEPSPVRVDLSPDGMFRARQGSEVLARARNAKKLRAAFRAAEPWMPEGWWTTHG